MSDPYAWHDVAALCALHDPYTEGGVRWGRHTILSTFPNERPWWRRLWPW